MYVYLEAVYLGSVAAEIIIQSLVASRMLQLVQNVLMQVVAEAPLTVSTADICRDLHRFA